MPSDDELSAIKFLNDSEERGRSPVERFAKDAVAAVGAILPGAGIVLGPIINMLDRRKASNREELLSALLKRVQEDSSVLNRQMTQSEDRTRFFKEEFPGLLVEAVRRSETVRSEKRIRRFAAILTHSLEVGYKDGSDYVEEMLRIATALSDWDVKVLDAALKQFVIESAQTQEAENAIAARAWLRMHSGIFGDELASIGTKLQSFGLTTRIEGITGDTNSFRVLERGKRFIEYILGGV